MYEKFNTRYKQAPDKSSPAGLCSIQQPVRLIIMMPSMSPPCTIPDEKSVGEAIVVKCMDDSGANKNNTNNMDEEVPAKV